MTKLKIGDLVYVNPPIPGSHGGSGIIQATSIGEESTQYLVEFEEGIDKKSGRTRAIRVKILQE